MKRNIIFRFLIGILLIFLISLAIFNMMMAPPMYELGLMALFLGITSIISALVGYVAYKLGWINLSPTLRWSLLGGYILSGLLTFFNVWFSAQMMFASQHDLLLAIVLLMFASGMAVVLGYFLSSAITDRIYLLKQTAEKLAEGNLKARVSVSGRDEVALLAQTFNQMAEQLESVDNKKRELEKMRADLIAWIGHDLQTPLASVRAILEALEDDVIDDPQTIKRYLNTAQRDVRSLSVLIDDLFQMAQLNAGGFSLDCANASLSDLISDTLESFAELAARQGVNLQGSVESNVDPVFMDTQRIGRVLNNLINNAIRHTPPSGEVKIYACRTGDGIEINISDTGEGIQPEDIPHIFEGFFRGEKSRSRNTGGAGLGLAISHGIIQAHGGKITVQSEVGKGSQFHVIIPNKILTSM
jgi:signal transduction histidine kinase